MSCAIITSTGADEFIKKLKNSITDKFITAKKIIVFSLLRQLSTWRCSRVLLRAPAAGTRRWRPKLSIDICGPQGAQQQTRRPPLLLSIDSTGRRTDTLRVGR